MRSSPAGLRSPASGSPSKKAPRRALMPRTDELVRPTTRQASDHRLIALDHGGGEKACRGTALSPVLAPLLVKDRRAHLRPVDPSGTKSGLTSSVGSPQNLPGDREGSNHPTPARLIRNPLQVGPRPHLIRLELAGRATSDHDSSLPARLL